MVMPCAHRNNMCLNGKSTKSGYSPNWMNTTVKLGDKSNMLCGVKFNLHLLTAACMMILNHIIFY